MNAARARDAAARALAIALPLGCGLAGWIRSDDALLGGVAWLVALLACLAGYGHAAERAVQRRVDLGLRLAWGAAVYLAVAGGLLAAGALSHAVLVGLVVVGLGGHVWRQLTVDTAAPIAALRELRGLLRRPQAAALYGLIAVIAGVNALGAVAEMQGNVYDDDVIYTPLVRRLLDVGNLDEPFSFRRISAYGGQTVLQALGAVRGTLANLFLVDGALFQIVFLLLLAGLVRRRSAGRAGVDDVVVGLGLLAVVLLPDTSVNTASYWTGAALFLALYRTVELGADTPDAAIRPMALAAVIAAAVATLRQSYLPVAALFLVGVLVLRWFDPRRDRRHELRIWGATVAAGFVALAPYCVATWRSSRTFLYPLWQGTFNPDIQMHPVLFGAAQELQLFLRVLLEPDPFRVTLVLLPVLCLAVDGRRGRPLTAFTVASLIGFVMLIHGFSLSNSRNLWRYAFGYTGVLTMVLIVEAGALGLRRGQGDVPVRIPRIGQLVVIGALLIQLTVSARGMANKYADLPGDLRAAAATSRHAMSSAGEARRYHDLQAAVPAGAPLAVLLDAPFHLDYARNPIFNLDTPGFASPRPGMPSFRGARPVVDYFLGQGIRYLAFVRGDQSRYMYRRDYWLHRLLWDVEIWRIQGAYTVDCSDNFGAIASDHRVLFEDGGMVVVDLAVPR